MSNNLAAFFADRSRSPLSGSSSPLQRNDIDDEDMGPSISMAVTADNDDAFEKGSFNLKRTRSMGLLNKFIDPTKKLLESDQNQDLTSGDNSNTSNNYNINTSNSITKDSTNAGIQDINTNTTTITTNTSNTHTTSLLNEKTENENPMINDNTNDMYNNENDESDEYDAYDEDDYDDDDEDVEMNDLVRFSHSASVSPPAADNDNLLIPQDDNDVMREPQTHVDYLSHHWNESEISNSWKYIILKKKKRDVIDSVNSARLENASWRTWAKARNNLKTVSPEIVNWSKDSDVTWLYGPVVSESSQENLDDPMSGGNQLPDNANIQLGYGSDDETSKRLTTISTKNKATNQFVPKPILKKRTVTEIIEENSQWRLNEVRRHMSEMRHANVVMDPYGYSRNVHTDEYNDYKALAGKINAQYYSHRRPDNSQQIGGNSNDTNENDVSNVNFATGQSLISNSAENLSDKGVYPVKSKSNSSMSSNSSTSILLNDDVIQIRSETEIKPPLLSILANGNGTSRSNKSGVNRHIHFNDRVEQCMAIKYQKTDTISSVDGSSDEDSKDLRRYGQGGYLSSDSNDFYNQSDSESNSGNSLASSDDENDGGGLFISARFSRRLDSSIHSPVTDTSSLGSTSTGRSLHPIIKLLPATTLNYGSDEESENSDYDSYGNAVSHNVNTYRGYDYMYDYNSVYTGDTSNFLPVDHAGIEDIPEGIDLQTSMEDDGQGYDYSQMMIPPKVDHQVLSAPQSYDVDEFMYDDNNSVYSATDSDEQFIEHSHDQSSGDNDEESADEEHDYNGLELKRTLSLGKTSSSNSLKELASRGSTSSLVSLGATHSFITGKVLTPHNSNPPDFINHQPSNQSISQRKPSTNNFIFDSDTEDEDSTDIHNESTPSLVTNCSVNPTTSSVLKPSHISGFKQPEVLKSFRIPSSTSSQAEVGSSDVAINGYFSPRNDSLKSVVSKKGLIERTSSNDSQ
ncbi:hypothetical protein Kpol_1061p5 [Vanderwaltozyma polyspora DSM 70294]|uniref:Nitrogen regulatory protein areA GATA-like domain-containing protein n=1 Tax=Vanderwaltozyma polyspora (strain ATCC 22028 / DSM 70294 / BCRC 21397 / CBS 2163 / NBRC 10782 / NRRL Y-8283 / UCD 57-17) TaxID=436907 RepID=A7TJD3_VANPO|nr:uncharacterized protein Kpol_1061p5 [Vanderwaltozyma polyspora DSM 70294]EDO17583.1 hypothetical protein Kpol_1061p5 [Vanderwaltozyma polyspora DSM 70294]